MVENVFIWLSWLTRVDLSTYLFNVYLHQVDYVCDEPLVAWYSNHVLRGSQTNILSRTRMCVYVFSLCLKFKILYVLTLDTKSPEQCRKGKDGKVGQNDILHKDCLIFIYLNYTWTGKITLSRNGTKVCTNRVETTGYEFCEAAFWCSYFSSAIFNRTGVMTTLPPGSSAAQVFIHEKFQRARESEIGICLLFTKRG